MKKIIRLYRCSVAACDHEWPARQLPGDEPLKFCPFCDQESAKEITLKEAKEGNQ